MAFFLKNRTINELKIYLNSLSLEQLVELNKSYGPHFEKLDNRQESAERQLKLLQEKLLTQQEKHQLLLAKKPRYIEDEAIRIKTRELLDNGGSRTERALLLGQLNSYSPMDYFYSTVMAHEDTIRNLIQQIMATENQVKAAKEDISLTIQELRILNTIKEARESDLQARGLAENPKESYPSPHSSC